MKPRCLLATVDRLPTISETQESDTDDGNLLCPSNSLEEYVASIKELSQPAAYPLHGPLRGHRRWLLCTCPRLTILNPLMTYTPWTPIDLSDVSLTLTDESNYETASSRFNCNLLDRLVAQSLFAGLV